MNTVYVVTVGIAYETGDRVLGVYATEAEAEHFIQQTSLAPDEICMSVKAYPVQPEHDYDDTCWCEPEPDEELIPCTY